MMRVTQVTLSKIGEFDAIALSDIDQVLKFFGINPNSHAVKDTTPSLS